MTPDTVLLMREIQESLKDLKMFVVLDAPDIADYSIGCPLVRPLTEYPVSSINISQLEK